MAMWFKALVGASLLAAVAGCGPSDVGEKCGKNSDCQSDICVIRCDDPCLTTGVKPTPETCGPHYCASMDSFRAQPVNEVPCYEPAK